MQLNTGIEYMYKMPVMELKELIREVNEIVEQRVRNGNKNRR